MDYKETLTDMVKTLIAQDQEGARAIAQSIVVAKSQGLMHGTSAAEAETTTPEAE
jgi:hypothetical protein